MTDWLTHRNVFLTFLEVRSPRTRCGRADSSQGVLLAARRCLPCPPLAVPRVTRCPLLIRTLVRSDQGPPMGTIYLNHFLKPHPEAPDTWPEILTFFKTQWMSDALSFGLSPSRPASRLPGSSWPPGTLPLLRPSIFPSAGSSV